MIRFKVCGARPVQMRVETAVVVNTGGGGYVEPYLGAYEVTPRPAAQTLYTRDRRMTENVTVYEIPYHETSNQAGGSTAVIGGV